LWRGGFIVTVTIAATQFQTGRLICGVNYGATSAPSYNQYDDQYFSIVDLSVGKREYKFHVPYVSDVPWLYTPHVTEVGTPGSGNMNYDITKYTTMGYFYIGVISQLATGNATSPPDVNYIVTIRPDDTFEFSYFRHPRNLQVNGDQRPSAFETGGLHLPSDRNGTSPFGMGPMASGTDDEGIPVNVPQFDDVGYTPDLGETYGRQSGGEEIIRLGTETTLSATSTFKEMGEEVSSLKDVLRRYRVIQQKQIDGSLLGHVIRQSVFAGDANATGFSTDSFAALIGMYVGWRGSLRYKAAVSGLSRDEMNLVYAPNKSGVLLGNLEGFNGRLATIRGSIYNSVGSAASFTEAEVPFPTGFNFLWTYAWSPATPSADNLLYRNGEMIAFSRSTMAASPPVNEMVMWQSFGDDTRVGGFIAPPMCSLVG
jgi:hypothetical protein